MKSKVYFYVSDDKEFSFLDDGGDTMDDPNAIEGKLEKGGCIRKRVGLGAIDDDDSGGDKDVAWDGVLVVDDDVDDSKWAPVICNKGIDSNETNPPPLRPAVAVNAVAVDVSVVIGTGGDEFTVNRELPIKETLGG
jgi:hypothetical protein